jgi:hypothetical protein
VSILTPADYPEVRAALSPDLGPDELPDDIIHRDVYQGAAEAEVLAIDPDALVHTDPADRAHVRLATIYLTAARLALRLTQIASERFAQYAVTLVPKDLNALYSFLRSQALEELGAISTIPDTLPESVLPPAMVLAAGGRGDVRPGYSRPPVGPSWG